MFLKNLLFTRSISRRGRLRAYAPLLAILALALATLACINTEVSIKVTNNEDGTDTLDVSFEQYLTDSFIAAAKEVNGIRKQEFADAGRETDTENLLPVTMAEAGELFNPQKYRDQGYQVNPTETGFKASKQIWLLDQEVTEDWQVRVIPDEAGNIFYQAKVWLDLSELEEENLFELRTAEDIKKPNLTPGAINTEASGGGLGDLFGVFGDMAAEAEQELMIEMYYIQMALKMSDPIEYRIIVELPGHINTHDLDGIESGTPEGNRVTLVLSEADIAEHAGKKIEFLVESKLKNCSQACQSAPHLIWDGKEEGENCNCVCEKGFEAAEGEQACVDCDTICSSSDPNLETDLAACEVNQCGCRCKAGYEINNVGTRCITAAEAEAEDRENEVLADSSPPETDEEGEGNEEGEGTAISPAALYADLEEFLAGEGITAPTPGMMAVSGVALTTLLAAWLVLNQISGISPQQSLEVIKTWSDGESPPTGADTGHPTGTDATESVDEVGSISDQRTPVQEGAEDQVVRHIRDVKDNDDAIKQTRKDFEALEGRIPDQIKNSDTWKNNVAPHIKNIKDYIKQGELDKARDWLDRVENLIEVREEVVSGLDHLTPDKQEAMVWTERIIKTLGHIASDTYQTVVIDPAKAAGEQLLPSDLSKRWGDTMDELSQDMSNTAQEIGELPRTAADRFTHKSSHLDHLGPENEYIKVELYGERDVPVEYPDFWGKGTRKVSELYNGAKNLLFGD